LIEIFRRKLNRKSDVCHTRSSLERIDLRTSDQAVEVGSLRESALNRPITDHQLLMGRKVIPPSPGLSDTDQTT
jgi:hypothetical protein